ncbi:Rieske (2Fe-2S) protein [Methanomethylovorans sp.]|uniref:Rieske (2Fe-2S) protein n=1 Tax=Methanomethylovorans sp. TaxID=2758717 RepID=UPI002FDDDD37
MPEPSWVFAFNAEELNENSLKVVELNDKPVLLIRKEGQIYALSNKCKHMGCPLSAGTIEDHTLRCSCHGWRYDIKTGEYLGSRDISLKAYESKIENGKVFVYI